jgi:hypothetical protein
MTIQTDTAYERGLERFEAAVQQNRTTIDSMPHGPERDAYVEGLADGASVE